MKPSLTAVSAWFAVAGTQLPWMPYFNRSGILMVATGPSLMRCASRIDQVAAILGAAIHHTHHIALAFRRMALFGTNTGSCVLEVSPANQLSPCRSACPWSGTY